MPVPTIDTDQIVITASRAPEEEARTPASVTIIDQKQDRAARRTAGPCPAPPDALGGSHACKARPVCSPKSAFAAPRTTTLCCSSTASAPTTRRPATSPGSSYSTPTWSRGSRSCAARSRRCGGRKRSAESSRSTASPMSPAMAEPPRPAPSACGAGARPERLLRTAPASPVRSAGSARPASTASAATATRTATAICRAGCEEPSRWARRVLTRSVGDRSHRTRRIRRLRRS